RDVVECTLGEEDSRWFFKIEVKASLTGSQSIGLMIEAKPRAQLPVGGPARFHAANAGGVRA
ncbi:MAG: hypothetical protein ACREQD_05405, partial [Candidatus Binataceae bacterium]